MSHIKMHREHNLDHEHARRAAEEIAAHLNERFTLDYRWEGDSLHFKRSGVDGRLNVLPSEVAITVKRDSRRTMTEGCLHCLDRCTSRDHQRCSRVPKIVDP